MATPNRKSPDGKSNVTQLRHAIDRGKTKDKVRVKDPAAAPFGTDEEAAGTPSSAEQVAAAAHAEMARHAHERNPVSTAVILLVVVLIGLVTIAAILWTR
jgi:hypothetical protein